MRQLNTGEIKLFDVVKDMGETNDLSKAMPEKTADMIRKLDAYLEKIGAWTMEEVYQTRIDELTMWIQRDNKEIAKTENKLAAPNLSAAERSKLKKQLESNLANRKRHTEVLAKQPDLMTYERWL